MSFISTKFHEILLSGFRGVALTRKTGLTDFQTGWGGGGTFPTGHGQYMKMCCFQKCVVVLKGFVKAMFFYF